MSVTLLDGGTGRELERMGAPFRYPEWSALALMEAPDTVKQVHRNFIDAGADVVTTNSYALVPFHIGVERFASDGARLAALAGRLARAAADETQRKVRVAGSLPPIGGSYRADRFDAQHARPILATLAKNLAPSADLWLAETMSCIAEAELVRDVIGADPRPLWLSFTLEDTPLTPGESRLRSGETVRQAADTAARLGAEALLFNCSQPEVMADAIRIARAAQPRLATGAYANAFTAQSSNAEANTDDAPLREDVTPAAYLEFANRWVCLGATIVGGCCGIGPEHIRRLREKLS